MPSAFLDKLVSRLDKLDPESIQTHFLHLINERGLLEAIFQAIQEGVMAVDSEGRLLYANRAAERFIGISFDRVRGRSVLRYLKVLDWDRLLESEPEAWAQMVSREVELTYPEHRFVSLYAVPMQLEEDAGRGVLIILRDITREREQEEELVESERFNAIKLLASGVAHEIGNPLNALTIHLQLIDRELNALDAEHRDPLKELVRTAREEISRLDAIITQFLRAIRPSKPRMQPTQPVELIKETLRLMRGDIEGRRIRVSLDTSSMPPRINLDRQQMKQVFFNVVKNALEAMPDGGALKIRFETGDAFLAVGFLDSGEGIAQENLSRIFEPYHTTKSHGSGLGMMIVHRIVQEHGGQVEVSSKPGEGTCVRILLPLPQRRIRMLHGGKETTAPEEL